MNLRFRWAAAVAVSSILSLSSCKKSADAGKIKLAMIVNVSSPFATITHAGVRAAEAELKDVKVDFVIPDKAQAADQQRRVDDLLARGVQGISISPLDPANQKSMLDGAASKCVLLTEDSDAPTSNRLCYVGTDNFAAGKQAGELVKKTIPNGGNIIVFVGNTDTQNAKDRYNGLAASLQGSNVTILEERTDGNDEAKALTNSQEAIVKHPDLACMVGLYAYNGPQILKAVADANRLGKIKIVCFDENLQTLQGIHDGGIEGTIVQQPYEIGRQSVKLMAAIVRGDKSGIPESKQLILPTLVIDKSNVDTFRPKVEQYLKEGE